MRKLIIPVVFTVLSLVPGLARADIIREATLVGANETPPNNSQGFGIAIVSLNDAQTTFTVEETFFGLTAPAIAGHIHVGPAGVAGPIVLPFTNPPPPNATSGTFTETLTAANFLPGGGLNTFADFVNAFEASTTVGNSQLYVNLHSTQFPGGEIRGQLVAPELIPEPGTLALFGLGLVGVAVYVRRHW
jgi:hypothetical protein